MSSLAGIRALTVILVHVFVHGIFGFFATVGNRLADGVQARSDLSQFLANFVFVIRFFLELLQRQLLPSRQLELRLFGLL